MKVRTKITCYLSARIEKEGDLYTSRCISLPVASQGDSPEEAMASLIEATTMFIDSCVARGSLQAVLLKYNWRPHSTPPTELPNGAFALPFPIDPVVAKRALECHG